ncbi:MAG TPA: peptidoglycan-binding domain-containing protein [Kineosporiaceae bacterium]
MIAVTLAVALMAALPGIGVASAAPRRVSLAQCPDLRTGSNGGCVVALQQRLGAMGVKIEATGYYGEQTRAAVLLFQGADGFEPTGIADRATLTALDGNLDQAAPGGVVPVASGIKGPKGTVTSHGVKECRITTCSYYLTRRGTRQLDRVFNGLAFQAVVNALGSVACATVGTWSVACEALISIGIYLIGATAHDAARGGSCLEIRIGRGLLRKFTESKLTVYDGVNCMD